MLQRIKIIIFLIVICIFQFSCIQTEDNTGSENFRENFLKSKNSIEIQADFMSLNDDLRMDLWKDKLRQLKTQNYSMEITELIGMLEMELRNVKNHSDLLENTKIKDIGVSLANLVPETDFILMFSTLENYENHGSFFDDKISQELILEVSNLGEYNKNIYLTGKAECNCRWTCSGDSQLVTSNCEETSIGCGFLWLGSCTKRARL